MSHLTPNEIHDHVYGFKASPHLDACPDCRRAAEAVTAERDALRAALEEEPAEPPQDLLVRLAAPPRRRPDLRHPLSLAAHATAAAVLLGLVWILTRPPSPPGGLPADKDHKAPDPIDRLIAELKSPVPLRRELAELALKAYRGTAVPKLEKAKADPALIDACRGITPEDRAVLNKLKDVRATIDMQNAPLVAVVEYLREISSLNLIIDAAHAESVNAATVSIKAADIPLDELLTKVLEPHGLARDVCSGGVVLVTRKREPAEPAGAAPLRFRADPGRVRRLVDALGRDPAAERELLLLGFAAERALWDALDAPQAETRGKAAELIRRLYAGAPQGPSPLAKKLAETKIDMAFENSKVTDMLEFVADFAGVPILLRADGDAFKKDVTFKVKDLSLRNTLKLLLSQVGCDPVVVGDVVLASGNDGSRILRTPESGAAWASPDEARQIEGLIGGLLSGDSARARKASEALAERGPDILVPLLHAAHAVGGDAAARCRELARRVADAEGIWLLDEPSGADLQALTPEQDRLLKIKMSFTVEGETLEEFLRKQGVKCAMKAGGEAKLHAYLRDIPRGFFLRSFTRLRGLDFYMDGTTIVVDTAANVRAAVGKK